MMEAEVRALRPQTKECAQLLEAGKEKEWDSPLETPGKVQLCPTL